MVTKFPLVLKILTLRMSLNVLSRSIGDILFYRNLCFVFSSKLISVNLLIIKIECLVYKNEHFGHLLLLLIKVSRQQKLLVIDMPSLKMVILTSNTQFVLLVQLSSMNSDLTKVKQQGNWQRNGMLSYCYREAP